jgi:hypothetical protein
MVCYSPGGKKTPQLAQIPPGLHNVLPDQNIETFI